MTGELITFWARWISQTQFFIEILKGGVLFATSKRAYSNLEAATIAARKALDALRQNNDQLFNETFSKTANNQDEKM